MLLKLRIIEGGWLSEDLNLKLDELMNFFFDGTGWDCHRDLRGYRSIFFEIDYVNTSALTFNLAVTNSFDPVKSEMQSGMQSEMHRGSQQRTFENLASANAIGEFRPPPLDPVSGGMVSIVTRRLGPSRKAADGGPDRDVLPKPHAN